MTKGARSLWWRWSWRDLRQHWVAVASIAAVIAIGTGVYAGLGSTAEWRRQSNDASFAALDMHDLRIALSPGTFAPSGSLTDLITTLPSASAVSAVTERLVVESQVDASGGGDTILVAAQLVGSTFGEPSTVDDLWLEDGAASASGATPPEVVLETKFADYYGLPPSGEIRIAGDEVVAYTGVGVAPEEFYVVSPQGGILAQADLAVLYTDLSTAQSMIGRDGDVNDAVLTLATGADRDRVEGELRDALDSAQGLSATISTRDDAEAYRVLYEDIDNDQQIWNALSALVLFAAALAAFNLISRIVEAQRREIGIGMALGLPRRKLAIRPLLVGLQVGVIGTVAGIAVGLIVGDLMRGLLESFLPLPFYRTPFQPAVFARGAVFGLVPPLAASIIPVWRAVRVEPIQAIRTGHLAATTGQLGAWTSRLRLPGSSIAQIPLRNLLRSPRRTVLTALGVGAAITALVAVLGMLDSFERTIDRGAAEVTKGDPDRVTVALDTFYRVDSPVVTAITESPAVATADPSLRLPATIRDTGNDTGTGTGTDPDDEIDLVLELLDFERAGWTPTIVESVEDGPTTGIVLAEKAAADLDVAVGDTVTVRHPGATASGLSMVDTELTVAALHPNPIRNFAFLDTSFADGFGLAGVVNGLQTTPATGTARGDVQRAVFVLDGVASAQPVARVGEVFDEALEQFVGFLYVTAGAVLVLALLIAFNSSRISVEERRREHATMLAFGVRLRTVVGLVTREAIAVGLLATIIGTVAGMIALRWMLNSLAARTLPDLAIGLYLSPATIVIAVAVGVLAVALAPMLLIGRIRRMNLPDTLRVME